MDPLAALAELVADEGDLPAGAVRPPARGADARLGRLAAAGPRARRREAEHALLVDAIREGHELHYPGRPRVVAPHAPALALLAGDRLYALGLARLADLGDV